MRKGPSRIINYIVISWACGVITIPFPPTRRGLVYDKKKGANDSSGGPDDGDSLAPQDGDTEMAQAVSPTEKKKMT